MVKTFKLEIECENAMFGDDDTAIAEGIAYCLQLVAKELHRDIYPNAAQWIRDINGNRVGTYKYENRESVS